MIENKGFVNSLVFRVMADKHRWTIYPTSNKNHLYLILNLENGILKLGISTNLKIRIGQHIGAFSTYGNAKAENLLILCSKDPLKASLETEEYALNLFRKSALMQPMNDGEFFSFKGLCSVQVEKMFASVLRERVVGN